MSLTQFDIASAGRIANVVRAVEGEPPPARPLTFGPVLESPRRKLFRMATFTGAWAINTSKTVTFRNQTTTPNTAAVTNLFCGMSPTASCDVCIAKEGTAWYVVQPNLGQLPGYSTSGTHVLAVVNSNLRFIGTTAC